MNEFMIDDDVAMDDRFNNLLWNTLLEHKGHRIEIA